MKKRGVKFIIFSLLLLGGIYILNDPAITKVFFKPDDGIKKVFSRNAIQEEARQLAKRGYFKEALTKYQEAIQPQYINNEGEKGLAIAMMRRIYLVLQDYDAALKCMEWVFQNSRDGKPTKSALEKKREIEALQHYQKTGDPQMVLEHLSQFVADHRLVIPPGGYGISSDSHISKIIRLYNTIGDHDAGIKFIDEILRWICENEKDDKSYCAVKTAVEAKEAQQRLYAERKNWHPFKLMYEYLTVRKTLERDKAEGFKGCAHSKPGEVCMGHATKALIESDYFPW